MKKTNCLSIIILAVMLLLPFVSADVITPGYHGIRVNNVITNINDFPDYVFISAPIKDGGPGLGMCDVFTVNESGDISSNYYKFCSISIYAIPKEKFNQTIIDEINNNRINYSLVQEQFTNYLVKAEAKEVIKNIDVYTEVIDSSPIKSITNYYTIDLNQTKLKPDNKVIDRNALIYLYIIIPIIALIIIFLIIKKKR